MADFLDWQPLEGFDRIAVVRNPPFGTVGNKARLFFNHAATFADYITFIMPASFAKPSMQATLDHQFHLLHQQDLLDEPFTLDGKIYRFNTVFQVWERRSQKRVTTKGATTHADFDFVKSIDDADFAIRRVGALAGKIIDIPAAFSDRTGLSASSNYFLRATERNIDEVRTTFSICDFALIKSQSVAVPSIGKRDLIACYDRRCV